MSRRRLLRGLARRIQAFERGDERAVLDLGALREIRALWQAIAGADPRTRINAMEYMAWIHWCRYLATSNSNNADDFRMALALFGQVMKAGSQRIPDPVRAVLRGAGNGDPDVGRAVGLLQHAETVDDPAAVQQAVELLTRSLQARTVDDPGRAAVLSDLGVALQMNFERGGPAADLDTAVEMGRQAVTITSNGDLDLASRLFNLGQALQVRFERAGTVADLEEALDVCRRTLATLSADHPQRSACLIQLSTALQLRFHCRGTVADLDEAVNAARDGMAATPADHPNRTRRLSTLGLGLRLWGDQHSDLDVLREAVDIARYVVVATPREHPSRSDLLFNLGISLMSRSVQSEGTADLDETIGVFRHAAAAVPAGYPEAARYMYVLGEALRLRFESSGLASDLNAAAETGRQAVQRAPDDRSDQAKYLQGLVETLRLRYERFGQVADLDEAVRAGRRAVLAPSGSLADRVSNISNLGATLWLRFERSGQVPDLDESIRLSRQAVREVPSGHSIQAEVLSNLSLAVRTRFQHGGDPADLEEAVNLGRQAVVPTRNESPRRARHLANLAATLYVRAERSWDLADLDEAVDLCHRASTAIPANHPYQAAILNNLANALHGRSERSGVLSDLEQAVEISRRVVTAPPAGDLSTARSLFNFGTELRDRFQRVGALSDLDEAVRAMRGAVAATPSDHPARVQMLSYLGLTLLDRFHSAESDADLKEAVVTARQAVRAMAAVPATHPRRARYLCHLALVLLARYEHSGTDADLTEAVDVALLAREATPDQQPNHAVVLGILSQALRTRFDRFGAATDLSEAIDLAQQAVAATPADNPEQIDYLVHLAEARHARFERDGHAADLDSALAAWSDAMALESAPAAKRLVTARRLASTIAQVRGPAAALDVYTAAVGLLDLLVWHGISRSDREHLLHTYASSLACDGAACAIAAGDPQSAVQLLEQGRGVLWSQLLDVRGDLAGLQAAAPDLAAELERCRCVIDRPSQIGGHDHDTIPVGGRPDADIRRTAARRFDEIVEQVRAMTPSQLFPRPSAFLRRPSVADMLPGADDDLVVVVNVSRWRCDALVVTRRGVSAARRLDITEKQVIDRANMYLTAVQGLEHVGPSRADPRALETAVTSTLEWLWDHIAAPVLDTLGHNNPPTGTWPIVWWCPTGALTVLPLQAAGYHHTSRSVYDRVVSSYAPTLRSLARARSRPESSRPPRMLMVALSATPELDALPGVDREKDVLAELLDEDDLTVLADKAATREAILADLSQHRWFHASCHGFQNLNAPSQGGLVPYDWRAGLIDITDLTSADQRGADFAFLSACKTAIGGVVNVDEAINVATAMHYAGWRHVIGTLWSVRDNVAADVTDGVYHLLLRQGAVHPEDAAQALNHTIRALRDAHRDQPSKWAPFIHTGL